jgi:hypothetical protein
MSNVHKTSKVYGSRDFAQLRLLKGFKRGDKRVMFTKNYNTRSSDYSLFYGTKNVVDQMLTLNSFPNSWIREW